MPSASDPSNSPADVFITSTGDRDPEVQLYDSNQTLLVENDDGNLIRPSQPFGLGSEFLLREGLQAGTYYIVVTHFNLGSGAYSLFIQTVPERGASIQDSTEISRTSIRAGTISVPGTEHQQCRKGDRRGGPWASAP